MEVSIYAVIISYILMLGGFVYTYRLAQTNLKSARKALGAYDVMDRLYNEEHAKVIQFSTRMQLIIRQANILQTLGEPFSDGGDVWDDLDDEDAHPRYVATGLINHHAKAILTNAITETDGMYGGEGYLPWAAPKKHGT
jgi:hypothetical protein